MRALAAKDMLGVWETARGYHPVDQALALLAAAWPERSRDELAALPLGQRDGLLLALRQATFGDRLPGRVHCPRCRQELQLELFCSSFLTLTDRDPDQDKARDLERDGFRVRLRPLDSFDLAAAAGAGDAAGARRLLLKRCATALRPDGKSADSGELPAAVSEAAAGALLAADPRAEILLDLRCPDCAHSWQALLDIVRMLWAEIAAQARRLLHEVHALASAYGWSEADILALSPARRGAYLRMLGS